jgi:hypothetical protein
MVPTPTASMDRPPNPLIGWGLMGEREVKSEMFGEMWQVAPLSRMKGKSRVTELVE